MLGAEPVIADVGVTNAQGETPLQLAQTAQALHGKPYMHNLLERATNLNAYHRHALVLKLPLLNASLHLAGIQTFHPSGPYHSHDEVPVGWVRPRRVPLPGAAAAAVAAQ